MPRGARAVHGVDVLGSYHGHGAHVLEATAISPVTDVLAVTCWCERTYVAVPQYDVRHEGITLSCGRIGCRGPSGDVTTGVVLCPRGGAPPDNVAAWMRRHSRTVPARPRLVAYRQRRKNRRVPRIEVEVRRGNVVALYEQRFSQRLIAERLGLEVGTVNNDLNYLRRKGRL